MPKEHLVYLALGSNLGDRAANLHAALKTMAGFAKVEATSFLYESPPAYVTDQPRFLNAACRITTRLSPQELLGALKEIERNLGRRESVRYGPRTLDLDILLWDEAHLAYPDLTIPHPALAERDFVLEPLCDLAPSLRVPALGSTVSTLWQRLGADSLPRVMPIGGQLWLRYGQTYIMGILNATPDSFSGDGLGVYGTDVVRYAVAQGRQMVKQGANCLDVGGQSTRPGHTLVSVQEEVRRVVGVIEALKGAVDVPISVDTFRVEVAEAALDAGADMVNDVWALRFDLKLGHVAAAFTVPLVMMHSRLEVHDPAYPDSLWLEREESPGADIVDSVRKELVERLDMAQALGIPRWLLVADPGIGFGVTLSQNLELIRRLNEVQRLGHFLLVGPSRKGFIGKVLGGLPAAERVEGTIAACVLAAERGANIVRVHDVKAVARALRMTDAILHGK